MMWGINFYLIFLFCYTNGQIKQVPIDEQQKENVPNKLKLIVPEIGGALPLKGKKVETVPSSQWEKDGEAAYRWSNGRIRYYVDPSSYDNNVASFLESTFSNTFNECPDFVELDDKPEDGRPWLHFTNPNRVRECVHDLGQENNGEIVVVLGYDCLKPGQVLHTVLHGLGFHDEVTHPQRDLFVRVQWENIQPAFKTMFRIHSVYSGALLDYDPKSIMQFHDRAYSLNGQATIASLLPGLSIEPSDELSHLDKMKIRLAFGHECKKRQIDKIFSSCGGNQNMGDSNEGYEKIIVPGKDITDIKGGGGQSGGGNGGLIVVPGTDIKLESDAGGDGLSDGGNAGQIVVPGTNIKVEDGQSDGDQIVVPGTDIKLNDGQSDGDEIVVPGTDLHIDNAKGYIDNDKGDAMSGSDEIVIPGTNVQLESNQVTDNELASGNDDLGESGNGEMDDSERERGVIITGDNDNVSLGAMTI